MAENVDGYDLFGSGGHVWRWDQQAQFAKQMGSVGIIGISRAVMHSGQRPLEICGADGGPALLKASAGSRAAADAALDALEGAIEQLRYAGTACAWEDDCGRTGTQLVITDYIRIGPRRYGRAGSNHAAWQPYRCRAEELWGRP